jgi:hypothetical protein
MLLDEKRSGNVVDGGGAAKPQAAAVERPDYDGEGCVMERVLGKC